ncbi:YidC/Oxa1 family membrane protein insertase [Vibrio sp. HN007]|uniref:YidC/Oxa1 family membrane protein insertase n=1 Tax=Vibrio iocasae TaxID=3098914 RepID=UPI0035D3FF82
MWQYILLMYSDFFIYLVNLVDSFGLATILLSLISAFLMFYPLKWAGKIATEEAALQSVIAPQLLEISKSESGLHKHQAIKRLYSRYSYHPIYAVRSLSPLFIQLPFLILTYFMLKGISGLEGQSFYWLNDLSLPDGVLYGDGNILPFLMTAINLLSILFIKNFSYKNALQAIFVSILFFVLLYNERSILLLFWTTNNLLLLIKGGYAYLNSKNKELYAVSNFDWSIHENINVKSIVNLAIYVFVSSLIFKELFNIGIVRKLSLSLYILSIGFLALSIVFALLTSWQTKDNNGSTITLFDKTSSVKINISAIDLLFLLLPISFVAQYALANQDIMKLSEQLVFISICTLCFFVYIWLVPYVLSKFTSTTGFVEFSLSLSLVYVTLPILASQNGWYDQPDIALLLASLLVLFGFVHLMYRYKRKLLWAFSVVFFLVSFSVNFLKSDESLYNIKSVKVDYSNFIPSQQLTRKPDIYLLTYDAYVANGTMAKYGIDNSEQEEYLAERNFKMYPKTYSLARSTLQTMARVLEMSDNLPIPTRLSTAGNALVPSILEKNGYHTYGILTPYFFAAPVIGYQTFYPDQSSLLTSDSVYNGLKEGQFRFDLIDETANYNHGDWITQKRQVMALDSESPKFMYTHTGPHHSQNSGKCLDNETELFQQRLDDANTEMKEDIETILASNREAIIIINGDHGPYLTGDCKNLTGIKDSDITKLHLQDRYGSFLAIRWPDNEYEKYDDIRVLQDTFNAVFKYLYQSDKVLNTPVSTASIKEGISGIEDNIIQNGIIMLGKNKGEPLFD